MADEVEPEATGEVVVPAEVEAVELPGRERVEIFNPNTPGGETADVTREAFEETWAAKGWRVVADHTDDDGLVLEGRYVVPEGVEVSGDAHSVEVEQPDSSDALVDEQSDAK